MASFATALRNARADAITTFAGNGAKLRVYTAAYGKLLVEFTCGSPFAPAAVNGALSPTIQKATASAGNPDSAAIARIYKADGTTLVMEGLTVGSVAGDILISSVVIRAGDEVSITSATITEGNA